MGKPSPPPAPDMSAIADASEAAADMSFQIAQEQLAWAKEQYAMDKETIDKVVDAMLEDQEFASENAAEDRERYETIFQPMEDQFVDYVENYNTPERMATEVGRAQANVAQQFDAARSQQQQQLESFGINPADTRYSALDIGISTQEAAAKAAAGTEAARAVENTGTALLGEAINIGRGYPGQVAASQAASQGAAQTASGATTSATSAATGAMGMPANYLQTGNQALDVWGTTLNQNYANQIDAYNAQLSASSGWGSALGSLAGMAMIPFMQEGGAIPQEASPTRGAIPDDALIAASSGEFVFPRDVVEWKGQEYMYKEIQKIREKRTEMLTGAIPETRRAA